MNMNKIKLTESFVVTDKIPKALKKMLDKELMIKEIKRAYNNNERVNSSDFYHDYYYTSLRFMKYYKWIGEYAGDHYSALHKQRIIFSNYSAIVLKPQQSLLSHNHIDDWDYQENSYDISLLYPLYIFKNKNKENHIHFEYENGRFKKQRFKLPLNENFLIMFSSELRHSISANLTKENMIFISLQFKYE
tara:strand:+ start:4157 stop:4726 length:570 start_codon:yes stop_codon:yes gene_type:complete